MSCKRPFPHLDPDYDQVAAIPTGNKRLKHIENDAKVVTIRKIDSIVRKQFEKEINAKEVEIEAIDDRLYQSRQLIDNLRAALVINFYSAENPTTTIQPLPGKVVPPPSIHPILRKYLGKTPKSSQGSCEEQITGENSQEPFGPSGSQSQSPVNFNPQEAANLSQTPLTETLNEDLFFAEGSRAARFKVKKRIVVGNISKYIPVDKRDDKDQSTHKWMVYVRGPRHEPGINHFVKKVWFFLHPTYRPNDLVEVSQAPFHLTRRGWGEFPVRVQLHFYDQRNKRVDIIHTLKLDKTFTGLQTLGAETVVDLLLYKPDMCLEAGNVPNCSSLPVEEQCCDERTEVQKSEDEKAPIFSSEFDHQYWRKHQGDNDNSSVSEEGDNMEMSKDRRQSDSESEDVKPNGTDDIADKAVVREKQAVDEIAVPKCDARDSGIVEEHDCDSFQSQTAASLDSTSSAQSALTSDTSKTVTCAKLEKLEDGSETVDKSLPANGLATFVKCVDKQGNFYLVPYSAFLKLHSLQGGAAMVVSATSVPHAGTSVSMPSGPKLVSLIGQSNKTVASALPSSVVKSSSPNSLQRAVSPVPSPNASAAAQSYLLSGTIGQKYMMDTSQLSVVNPPGSCTELVRKNAGAFQVGRSILKPRQDNDGPTLCVGAHKRFDIDECATMVDIVQHLIKMRPLCHPVCSSAVEKFLNWNVGKRCALEWQRAKSVQKDILEQIEKSCNWKAVDVWTVKKILLWARHYGYTPLKPSSHNSSSSATQDTSDYDVDMIKMNTYTSADLLLKRLREQQQPQIGQLRGSDSSDDEIDIVSVNDVTTKCRSSSSSPKNNSNLCKLLYTKEADFVRDTALQIDVKLRPMQIIDCVEGPVAEELLFSAMKQFMEDLLRNSLAKAFQRVQNKRNPDAILLTDVVNMLCELPFCDFLTNRHLGKCEGSSVCLNNLSKF